MLGSMLCRSAFRTSFAITACLSIGIGDRANAQAVLQFKDSAQRTCVATTDMNGITLQPNGLALQATGVKLTGAGCPVAAGGSVNFQTTLSLPSVATVGTPVVVTWSAGVPATTCVYGSPSVGVAAGWKAGSIACTGTMCAGLHQNYVTFAAGGVYTFSLVCTDASGYASTPLTAR